MNERLYPLWLMSLNPWLDTLKHDIGCPPDMQSTGLGWRFSNEGSYTKPLMSEHIRSDRVAICDHAKADAEHGCEGIIGICAA